MSEAISHLIANQPFELVRRFKSVGDATLIRCKSPIDMLDLNNDDVVDEL